MPTFYESLECGNAVSKPMHNSLAEAIAMPYVGVNAFHTTQPLLDKMVKIKYSTIKYLNVD